MEDVNYHPNSFKKEHFKSGNFAQEIFYFQWFIHFLTSFNNTGQFLRGTRRDRVMKSRLISLVYITSVISIKTDVTVFYLLWKIRRIEGI